LHSMNPACEVHCAPAGLECAGPGREGGRALNPFHLPGSRRANHRSNG
jgi:hypothetical protein